MQRVAVVGAGITGLALTEYLAARDVDVMTFEADSEPGGIMRSRRIDGRVVEDGPQRLRLTDELESLVETVGMTDELRYAPESLPLYVYADGKLRLVPKAIREFLRTDIVSTREKFRMLRELFSAPIDDEETVADAFRRKFGTRASQRLFEPLIGGMYGSDATTMPAGYALERLIDAEAEYGSLLRLAVSRLRRGRTLPPVVSFDDGVQRLPEALYDRHSPYVHLDQAVESIEEFAGNQYAVRTGRGSVGVDSVVLTVPATPAAHLLADLPDTTIDPLRDVRYNDLVLVHLETALEKQGFGYQVASTSSLHTRGVTWNTALLDRDGVATAFLGGMNAAALLDRSDEAIGEIAAEEFESVTGASASVLDVRRLPEVIPAYDESIRAVDEISLPADIHLATNYTDRIGIPGRLRHAKRLADAIVSDGRFD